jgi:N-acetyl-anhydromuramyl-L-alanine amidase AmpD
VHFLLDTDGTIYQMLDLRERGWHATKANSRSVGVEIANIGAFPVDKSERLEAWYQQRSVEPMTAEAVVGEVQGQKLRMYDLTARQYEALIRLTAGLCRTLPRIECDYPRSNAALSDAEFNRFRGILGHYHVQTDKVDPGPAFQWDRVIDGARAILQSR